MWERIESYINVHKQRPTRIVVDCIRVWQFNAIWVCAEDLQVCIYKFFFFNFLPKQSNLFLGLKKWRHLWSIHSTVYTQWWDFIPSGYVTIPSPGKCHDASHLLLLLTGLLDQHLYLKTLPLLRTSFQEFRRQILR